MPLTEWRDLIEHGLLASFLGALGRLLSLAKAKRRPRGWGLLWEVPLAVGMGLMGISIATYAEVANTVSYGIIIGISYLGPQVVDQLFDRYLVKAETKEKS